MIDTAELTINTTNGGIRLLVRVPSEDPPTGPDGLMKVSFDILDVLDPPEARQQWLQYLKQRYGQQNYSTPAARLAGPQSQAV